ncbi:MAG: GUN4 domain-containing protein [Pseudanabaenaceae cyanobacterium bins.68]|nr:GUN4 domain-containing protein [Pseudanabaenaceae cyanobacterium bins.68]
MSDRLNPAPQIPDLASLSTNLQSPSEATQLKAILGLQEFGVGALPVLTQYLAQSMEAGRTNYLTARAAQAIYQLNQQAEPVLALNQLFAPLQDLLLRQEFEAADRLTSKMLCQLASPDAAARGWIYFSEVAAITSDDLRLIDHLWQIYSESKFGFSLQRRLWLGLGKNWESLWLQIGWKQNGSFTRYPQGFCWNLTAPKGHLPLSNQIRGNKTIEAIFNHPAWRT